MLQTQTVAKDTLALIQRLMAEPRLNDFTLVGGTALALMLGHRLSIDIDLFASSGFDSELLAGWLKTEFNATDIQTIINGAFCFINDVKIDLITHAYPEVMAHQTINGIRMMSLTDIAAMKLHAIVQSGTRLKDFTDIYFLLEQIPMSVMYAAYERKYFPDGSAAVARLALNDTSGINLDDEIHLIDRPFDWQSIKKRLQEAIESPQKTFLVASHQGLSLNDKTDLFIHGFEAKPEKENMNEPAVNNVENIPILEARPIQNEALLRFLKERKIPLDTAQEFCSEVDFLSDSKVQTAIGFENKSGGFELLSGSYIGSISPIDVSISHQTSDRLVVFENFLDLLSFVALQQKRQAPLPSFLVLNVVSLFEKSRPLMEQYQHVSLFLCRDEAGRAATAKALDWNGELNMEKYGDGSKLYGMNRSLSEWLKTQPTPGKKATRKLGRGL